MAIQKYDIRTPGGDFVYALTTLEEMQEFIEKLVSLIPGVDSYEVYLLDPNKPISCEIKSTLLGILRCNNTHLTLEEFNRFSEHISKDIYLYPIVTATSFYGFIAIKPSNPMELDLFASVLSTLSISISTILENKFQKMELELHRKHLQQLVSRRTASLERAKKELELNLDNAIQALAATIESRDPYTAGHQYRVAMLSQAIAKKMKLSKKLKHEQYLGALIHDIGKIQVPIEILTSPIKLTHLQMDYIKIHPKSGWDIIQPLVLGTIISDIILHHHERLDGSGYPHGLTGESIPVTTKIVSVADVFEAMSSHRPYRPMRSQEETLDELRSGAGKRYDKTVVNACIRLIANEGFLFPTPSNSQLFVKT
jgi:HD-GYP domain-containing protein (c-di-GMP phosphodiesterase class II)